MWCKVSVALRVRTRRICGSGHSQGRHGHLESSSGEAINDQASSVCYIWVKDDIQQCITDLHNILSLSLSSAPTPSRMS